MVTKERHGPWAVIIGGSEGIGLALAEKLAVLGINLALVARKPEPLEEAAKRARAAGNVEVRTLSLDATRDDFVDRIAALTAGEDVGLLVHNVAGLKGSRAFLDMPVEEAMLPVSANCVNLVKLVHHYGRPMVERGRGGILMFGSMAGNVGGANLATYSAAKAFSQILAEALWAELEPRGVDVLTIVIGSADTPARRRSGVKDGDGFPVAEPEDVAQQALDCIADGPVLVPPGNEDMFHTLNSMPRREAADMLRGMLTQMATD